MPHVKTLSIKATCDICLSRDCGIRGESVSNADIPCCMVRVVRNTIIIVITLGYDVFFVCYIGEYLPVINVDSGLFILQGAGVCQSSLLNVLYPLHICGESRKIARFSRVAAG